MITERFVKYIYQPIADFTTKHFGVTCYQIGQQCCVANTIFWLAQNFGDTGIKLFMDCLLAVIWLVFMHANWKEGERLINAMLCGRPALSKFSEYGDSIIFLWLVIFGGFNCLELIDHGTTLRTSFAIAVDISYVSMVMFYLCRPMMPRPKREKIPNGALSEAGL